MAHYSLYLVDGTLYKMSMDERIAHMNELDKKYTEAKAAGKLNEMIDMSNPFPEWVRDLIAKLGPPISKPKFDRVNNQYKVDTPATDEDESDEEYSKFKVALAAAAAETPERTQWYNTHHIQVSTAFESEHRAMDELEVHMGGKPAGVGAKKKRKK